MQLKFDVTAAGVVENVSVVESSDAQFEESAIRAALEVALLAAHRGRQARAARGTSTRSSGSSAATTSRRPIAPSRTRNEPRPMRDFARVLGRSRGRARPARRRRSARRRAPARRDAGRCTARSHVDLWSFYGYLYTVQGNYDRAIDAYETARRRLARDRRSRRSGPCVPLANLYFARHQYDLALKTLLRPRQAASGADSAGGSGSLERRSRRH